MEVVAYLRNSGVICYEAPLLDDRYAVRSVQAARISGLAWHWLSVRRVEADTSHDRCLTPLSPLNERLLLQDVAERDVDGYGRAIVLIGTSADTAFPQTATILRDALTSFGNHGTGGVEVVISHLGDCPVDQIFIPANPSKAVREFFTQCGMDEKPSRIRKYGTLRSAALESLIDSIFRYASGGP